MSKPLTATCDKCGDITNVNFLEVYKPGGIKVTSFNCQHCQHNYVCFVTDHDVRHMQKVKGGLNGEGKAEERLRLQEDINARMDVLKREYTNDG